MEVTMLVLTRSVINGARYCCVDLVCCDETQNKIRAHSLFRKVQNTISSSQKKFHGLNYTLVLLIFLKVDGGPRNRGEHARHGSIVVSIGGGR